jgi:3-methyladenine DNA glycosylase AlkD
MAVEGGTADDLIALLRQMQDDCELEKVRARLVPGEQAIGLRMGDLFEAAKSHQGLPFHEVDRLLDHPAYEVRMAALCILDFRARRRIDDAERRALYDLYLDRHDRITTWDMVDRAAPRVVGGWLAGRSPEPLHVLAASPDTLRRRCAITAPLFFVRYGEDADVAGGFAVAAVLAGDPDPTVHRAVGIFLKHAGARDPDATNRFLDVHAPSMPRPALRLAVEKLDPADRARHVEG